MNKRNRRGDVGHKLARSCRTIGEVASLALADCDQWQELEVVHIVDVVPEPGSGRVLVLLAPDRPLDSETTERVEQALARVTAYVRCEVAHELQRKRAFDLALVLLPLPAGEA
jgi:hypothetical protein